MKNLSLSLTFEYKILKMLNLFVLNLLLNVNCVNLHIFVHTYVNIYDNIRNSNKIVIQVHFFPVYIFYSIYVYVYQKIKQFSIYVCVLCNTIKLFIYICISVHY